MVLTGTIFNSTKVCPSENECRTKHYKTVYFRKCVEREISLLKYLQKRLSFFNANQSIFLDFYVCSLCIKFSIGGVYGSLACKYFLYPSITVESCERMPFYYYFVFKYAIYNFHYIIYCIEIVSPRLCRML